MCFQVLNNPPIKRIAVRDMTVYKVLDKFLSEVYDCPVSLIQGFKYELNKLYSLGEELKVVKRKPNRLYIHTIYEIYKGFHSYSTMHRALQYELLSTYVLIYCIIPKGTVYYINDNEEIVSESIKICNVISLLCVGLIKLLRRKLQTKI